MRIRTRLFLSCLPTLILGLLFTLLLQFASFDSFKQVAILAILSLLLTTALSLHFMAGKIARPIKKLNRSALKIAAGHYGESIQINGPKELEELTNTLNTMSECLLENINHLKESTYLRENNYNQMECARFLQTHFLQRNIDACASDAFSIKAISFASLEPRGFLLDFPKTKDPSLTTLSIIEAKTGGLEGMYELMGLSKKSIRIDSKTPSLSLSFNQSDSIVSVQSNLFAPVILWSQSRQALTYLEEKSGDVQSGDYLFIINRGFLKFFRDLRQIADLLKKVLNVFGEDGLEVVSMMMEKEISFHAKRRDLESDLHLLCLQILNI